MVYDLSKISGKALEYVTEGQIGSGNYIHTQVIASPIDVTKESLQNIEAYEWLGIRALIVSDSPCCWVLSYEDFYTSEQYDSRNIECGSCDEFNFKMADFSLKYNEKTYDECRMILRIYQPSADGLLIKVFYRVPSDYDGCILGFHNSAALSQEQLELGMSDPTASLGFIARADGDLYIRIR